MEEEYVAEYNAESFEEPIEEAVENELQDNAADTMVKDEEHEEVYKAEDEGADWEWDEGNKEVKDNDWDGANDNWVEVHDMDKSFP